MAEQGGSLPHPLVPIDADLRDFAFMPVDIARLFGSEFHGQSSDAEWRAGVTLWLKSYHQVPAASLPADDLQLARLAEFGRDIRGWKKVRLKALRGWIECCDGRLYHPVVAEKALEAWIGRLTQRLRGALAIAKRWGKPADTAGIEADILAAATLLRGLNPSAGVFRKADIQKILVSRPEGTSDEYRGDTARISDAAPEEYIRNTDGTPEALPEGYPGNTKVRGERGEGTVVVFQPGDTDTSQDVEQGARDGPWDVSHPFGREVAP